MDKDSKIYIAGHRGLVGSAIMRRLKAEGYKNLITRTHAELDLTRQERVEEFFHEERPDYVFPVMSAFFIKKTILFFIYFIKNIISFRGIRFLGLFKRNFAYRRKCL